ncbi:hypothetical protein [Flavilitoribacter nigricans]|uniref:Uncharacterized protein n=1 Tax=Flavilitoribacter nigricans (strain ATCC 23147 / DSM 23189 / NBRC 102662 / NCIMB 1420 / SS-2) TaxID=1122177 RepID=A0A2D0MZW1_FLAN2|nr:hypothetical protein [Flavilitoribacter nigricans]PHN01668.1 hypothetical protein CRP01_36230 [Flavilitoribacter nigricans DSM 23189 = NBRC 102662]
MVKKKYYSFGKAKMPIRFPDSEKLGLSKEKVKRLEEADLSDHFKIPNMPKIGKNMQQRYISNQFN